ncbi:alpha/beta hydrolase [Microbacterium sp. NPDC012755]|uniref:alpha/beta hydrolase n=1 Tax=Microbacterium sp. NPDC012755 TaxID=3364184 RepID=UPI0036AE283B
MDGTVTAHSFRTMDVPVAGGALHVGVWDPVEAPTDFTPAVLVVHGVTSSHLAWPFVVDELPGVRVIAPDLRGRGLSNAVSGPAGLRAHAADLVAVLDALGESSVLVIGHSMGAFVALVFAHRHPERVRSLVLVDGGLPLDVPDSVDADELVAHILGPTAERLSHRWASVEDYIEGFWRPHPAFTEDWSPELERYIAYDLMSDGDALRPTTSYRVTVEDTLDMNLGTELPDALTGLVHETLLLTVPRGLQNEPPGLYAPGYLEDLLRKHRSIRHVRLEQLNHYTVVMSHRGARMVGPWLRQELDDSRAGQ